MKIGLSTQRERALAKNLRQEISDLVEKIRVKYPEPNVDDSLILEMLNFCVYVLAANKVDRQLIVAEFDRAMASAQEDLNQ